MLAIESMSVAYGRRQVLSDLSVEIAEGVTALIGLNGEGKTTLLRAVAGLVPFSGGVFMDGSAIDANRVRYAPQFAPEVRSVRVDECLIYLAMLEGCDQALAKARSIDVLRRIGFTEGQGSLRLSELSGGLAKRFLIGQTMLTPSQLLLLDEPTSGLDPVQRRSVGEVLGELRVDRSIIFSTHDMSEVVDWADRFIWLSEGQIRREGLTCDTSVEDLHQMLGSTA